MIVQGARAGLVAFVVLAAGVATNLLLLQPRSPRIAAERQPGFDTDGRVRGAETGSSPRAGGKGDERALDAETLPLVADVETIRAIQRELQLRGYETGAVDGALGLMTRAAIMAYEFDHAMPLTADPREALLKAIILGEAPPAVTPGGSASPQQGVIAEQVIRTVQQGLKSLGYGVAVVSGKLGEDTVKAIREFELAQQLPETGRISGPLVARLARLTGQGRIAWSSW